MRIQSVTLLALVLPLAAACDAGDDGQAGGAGGTVDPSAITWESLEAARTKLVAGEAVAALNADGSAEYRHTFDEGTQTDTEELVIDGVVLMRWTYSGAESHIDQDTDADGTFDRRIDGMGGEEPVGRTMVITSGLSPSSEGTRRETYTQTSEEMLDVTIEEGDGAGAWTIVDSFETTVLQPAGTSSISYSSSCTATQQGQLDSVAKNAVSSGLACLDKYRVHDLNGQLAAMLATRGLHFNCGEALPGNCAEASLTQVLLSNAFGPDAQSSAVIINTGAALGTPGACVDPVKVIFHELLHPASGELHFPGLDLTTHEGHSRDRIYSCAEICYDPEVATRCECATCLQTSKNDPRCKDFTPCGGYSVSMSINSPMFVLCGSVTVDLTDRIGFKIVPKPDGSLAVEELTNPAPTFDIPTTPGMTVQLDTNPDVYSATKGTVTQAGNTLAVKLDGTGANAGGCTLIPETGDPFTIPAAGDQMQPMAFDIDLSLLMNGTHTYKLPTNWSVTVTE